MFNIFLFILILIDDASVLQYACFLPTTPRTSAVNFLINAVPVIKKCLLYAYFVVFQLRNYTQSF